MKLNTKSTFFNVLILFIIILFPWVIAVIIHFKSPDSQKVEVKLFNYQCDTNYIAVDHSKFEILQQDFTEPEQLTAACLSCHNTSGQELMQTSHWNWSRQVITKNGDTAAIGKKNIINNFCINISSNKPRCTSCHIGYGWDDTPFDFTHQESIDCIVCHDQTGTYKKFPTAAGYPVKKPTPFGGKTINPPDYNYIAANVGKPKRENCGVCHYSGGGGNNVKHGDLEKELSATNRNVDVHMAIEGENMSCIDCHKSNGHKIQGQLYTVSSHNKERTTCLQCHTSSPHENDRLNRHTQKVACQTCHIPTYAKGAPTKMNWDWSTAGKHNLDGSIMVKKDSNGVMTYHGMKGNFVWQKNVIPEYTWFNGEATHYLLGDKITDTTMPVQMNTLLGNYHDENSKIIPVKVHRAKQIYDPVNKTLIVPHLFGKDSTAYWKNFDWDKAARTGMASVDLPYSGEFDFIKTEMYWPVNHMVAPREASLTCVECHARQGRLENLSGFYLIGRDKSNAVDKTGILLILMAAGGVFIHALLRYLKLK